MNLFAELQRRKVFKVGAAYLVVGWLLIQVSSTVAPQLNLPDWAPRLITLIILIGFPITLLLAWIFEATPEGIRVDSGTVGNKGIFVVCAILAALAVGWYWRTRPVEVRGDSDARSIAVLPFVNMSDDKGNEYFSDGISEEILNVLARTPDLRVAARTSSFSFRKQEKEVPDIARELKVRMVLEGSVRKQGERVRVTAQLIDADKGFHVWSQTYDRDLKDIFAIQDEIANAIADELKVKLDATHAPGAVVPDTNDLGAYDLYLKGMALWAGRGGKNLLEAVELFRTALKKDPNYAKAWAGLALTYAILPEWSEFPYTESRALGRDAAEHALALDPALPEPFAALAYVAGTEFRYATSRALYDRAIAIAPSYATAYQWYGETLQGKGDVDAGVTMLRKAVGLDPKSSIVSSVYANLLYTAHRDDEAIAACEAMAAAIDEEWCPLIKWDVAVSRKDNAPARAALEQVVAARGPGAIALFHAQMDALEGKGDVEAIARKLMDVPDGQMDPNGVTPMAAPDVALWLVMAGRNDLAIEKLARYRKIAPQNTRLLAFDAHLAVLHCEPRFIELMRSLKVEEPHLATDCPKGR